MHQLFTLFLVGATSKGYHCKYDLYSTLFIFCKCLVLAQLKWSCLIVNDLMALNLITEMCINAFLRGMSNKENF